MKTNADTRNVTKRKARELLDSYLKGTGHRHTPERSAILDAVYDQRGHFTLDELAKVLEQRNFPVSRATLYNTMRLFIKLRLVVRHRFIGRTSYEACYASGDHIHQVCTVCGSIREVAARGSDRGRGQIASQPLSQGGVLALYLWRLHALPAAHHPPVGKKRKQENKKKLDKNIYENR